MLYLSGNELQEYIHEETEKSWKQRDFISYLEIYTATKRRKVLGISGLRGTGKTVGLLQFLDGKDGIYITAQKGDTQTGADYIEILKNTNQKIIVIDEYTWIKNREDLDGYLYTLTQNGKKVIITGTESIAIGYMRYGQLIHRMELLNVNHFSYEEFCRMNGLEKCKISCEKFLTTAGVFPEYVINNFESMRRYVKEAIINNLTSCAEYMHPEYAAAIVYTILHKAVCDSTVQFVPQIIENRISVEDFLDEVGVDSSIRISQKDFDEVSSILRDAGIIITVPNYRISNEYRTYITNPALTYQMIYATHDLTNISEAFTRSLLGYMFEASCVVHVANYLIGDGSANDKLYYLHGKKNGQENEIDFIIEGYSKHNDTFLFECKLNDGPVIKETSSLVSDNVENMLGDKQIGGRYVVYNGQHNYDKVNNKEILYIGLDNMLSQYYAFSANKKTIMQEIAAQGRQIYEDNEQCRILNYE